MSGTDGGDGKGVSHHSAEGWNRFEGIIRGYVQPGTDRMLDRCEIGPGTRVLDVAAGTGLPSLQIAERVGPDGYVLATDRSQDMLGVLQGKAESSGLRNIETRVLDGQNLDVPESSFDAVVCQFGLMLFPDPDASLASMHAALRAGGRVGIAVMTRPDRNPHLAIPAAVTRKHLSLPPPEPGQPGHFSLGAPGLMEGKLAKAGFVDVTVDIVASELRAPSAQAFVDMMRGASGGPTPMLANADDATKEAIWAEIAQALGEFDGTDGCVFPGEVLVASAARP